MVLNIGVAAVVGLAAVALGASQSRFVGDGVSRQPILREKKMAAVKRTPQPGDCIGGAERIASIELVPDAIVSQGSRSWVEYHSDIALNRAAGAGVSWEADVTNDRGQLVLQHLSKGGSTVTAKAARVVTTGTITASSLADGFYTLRIRAAVSAPPEPDDIVEALQYFQVEAGKWTEITDAQWRANSRVALATPVATGVAQ